jgi:signal transduction histidine kinase
MRLAVPDSDIHLTGNTGSIVEGDELQIIQVLNNLLSNAIKYSPESKKVEVSIHRVANFVKISVRDYGMGINYQDRLKIFERFFRVSHIQKKFPGLGIGSMFRMRLSYTTKEHCGSKASQEKDPHLISHYPL